MLRYWSVGGKVLLAVTLLLLGPGLALAAEGGAGEDENPLLAPRFDLGLWSIVVFVLLFMLLRRVAWGPMLEGLQKREKGIHGALKEADEARAAAQALRQQFEDRINQAHGQVRDMLDEARKEAQAARDQMLAEARNDIQAERDRLHREMDLARDQALQQIWTQTAQLAAMVSSKALRRQMTPEDHRNLVEEALADLRRAGEQRQQMVAGLQ
jgi:F-type H+-transporting ATPase subunit b